MVWYQKVNYFKVIKDATILTTKFYAETLNKPWMRVKIFFDTGPLARTPEHYKKFYYDWQIKTPSPVHYIPEKGNWKIVNGQVHMVQNRPLPLIYPFEAHKGIWGGEAVIKGFERRKPKRRRVSMYWMPNLKSSVVHSEILDKYMKMVVTERTLQLIDDNYGFDSYILNTPPADLMSELALKLRRDMIYAIMNKSLCPDDPQKRDELYEKHQKHILPEEELEWYGLPLAQAYRKQMKIEEENSNAGPYKHIFRKELIQHLRDNPNEETEKSSIKNSFVSKMKDLNIKKMFGRGNEKNI